MAFDPLDPPDPITVARRLLVGALVLAGIRLAEIYRERLFDRNRADALLDHLMVKYPASAELRVARRLPA